MKTMLAVAWKQVLAKSALPPPQINSSPPPFFPFILPPRLHLLHGTRHVVAACSPMFCPKKKKKRWVDFTQLKDDSPLADGYTDGKRHQVTSQGTFNNVFQVIWILIIKIHDIGKLVYESQENGEKFILASGCVKQHVSARKIYHRT